MGYEVPARVINSLLNGPGFELGFFFGFIPLPQYLTQSLGYDAPRLFGIAGFWLLVGLALDRRRKGQSLDQHRPILSIILFTSIASLCAIAATAMLQFLISDFSFLWHVLVTLPLGTFYTVRLGLVIWLIVFCIYFARRSFIAIRKAW